MTEPEQDTGQDTSTDPADGTPADDRTAESADLVTDPPQGDPADLSGSGAEATVDQMHGEVDEIAEQGTSGPDAG